MTRPEQPQVRTQAQTDAPQPSTEENVHAVVYYALFWGMIASTLLFAIGVLRALTYPAARDPMLVGGAASHHDLSWFAHGVAALDPTAIMMAATVVLILTPVARVLASIYAFLVDRDMKYVVITASVLLIMVVTVVAGLLGLSG